LGSLDQQAQKLNIDGNLLAKDIVAYVASGKPANFLEMDDRGGPYKAHHLTAPVARLLEGQGSA